MEGGGEVSELTKPDKAVIWEIERLNNLKTALRAHAERLAEALEELIKVLRKEAPGTPLNHYRFDQLGIDCNNAITAYRAERPKK